MKYFKSMGAICAVLLSHYPVTSYSQAVIPLGDFTALALCNWSTSTEEPSSFRIIKIEPPKPISEENCVDHMVEMKRRGGQCYTAPWSEDDGVDKLDVYLTCSYDPTAKPGNDFYSEVFSCGPGFNGGYVVTRVAHSTSPRIKPPSSRAQIGDDCAKALTKAKTLGAECSTAPTTSGFSATCDHKKAKTPSPFPETALLDCSGPIGDSKLVNMATTAIEYGLIPGIDSCTQALDKLSPHGHCSLTPFGGDRFSASCDLTAP